MRREIKTKLAWIGWLAGIIDGEACLSSSWRKQGRSIHHLQISIRISTTDFRIPLKCYEITKMGFIYYVKSKSSKWKDWATWCVKGGNAIKIIEQVYPLLISKKEQADIFLKWKNLERFSGGVGRNNFRRIEIIERAMKQRTEIHNQLKIEKHKRMYVDNIQIQKKEEKLYENQTGF
jgi:hypothetical protein